MAALDEREIADLILSIYRAAEDPLHWTSVLERIRVAVQGSGAGLLHQDSGANSRGVSAFAGFGHDVLEAYSSHYHRLDPWGNALTKTVVVPERVVDGRALVSDADVQRSEYFADFGRHVGSARCAFSALEPAGSRTVMAVIGRAAGQPPFETETLTLMARLTPHLRQAFRLHRRIGESDALHSLSCDALERLRLGVILVDASGCALFLNAAARRIFDRRDGLWLNNGKVLATTSEATRRISRCLQVAVALCSGVVSNESTSALSIARPSGRPDYRVVVVPAGHREDVFGHDVGASAAIFVSDPDSAILPDVSRLRELFGLTPTEATIAARLANGETLIAIAAALGMKASTVRWHMKRILPKAQVTTQAQFVSLILSGPATLA